MNRSARVDHNVVFPMRGQPPVLAGEVSMTGGQYKVMAVGFSALLSFVQAPPQLRPDPARQCPDCEAWNAPREPFRIFGNTYYVGAAGVSAVLIASPGGLILLDGGLPQTASNIDAGIRKLGFRTQDIRLIVNSHEHYDHAGGIAALQRASGAEVAASAAGARTLERGEPSPDDPQYGLGRDALAFPSVAKVRSVRDGEVLRVGDLAITAHLTPGHTPGATTWSWRSCEGTRCLNVVYVDSLNPVSAPDYRFTARAGVVDAFRQSIAKVSQLPCDIIIGVHPNQTEVEAKLTRREQQKDADAFIDPRACRAYAAGAARRLDARIAEEKK
jgi:metallo-beta-lactamase class B